MCCDRFDFAAVRGFTRHRRLVRNGAVYLLSTNWQTGVKPHITIVLRFISVLAPKKM
jgi:hypothetical protein